MGEINLFVASKHLNKQFSKMSHCFKVLETYKNKQNKQKLMPKHAEILFPTHCNFFMKV